MSYELTVFCNPDATDIRLIRPYAAYSLTHDAWTVHPPELPPDWDPRKQLSPQWFAQYERENDRARDILTQVALHASELRTLRPGVMNYSAHQRNSATLLHDAARQGVDLFDSIHEERHNAFGPNGNGYADYYNVRWQAHKRDGTVKALKSLKDLWKAAHTDAAQQCYDGPILDAKHALTMAVLVGASGR